MQAWCEKRQFGDGQVVAEGKLLLFLQDEVMQREIRTSRYKRERKTDQGRVVQTLGFSACKSYVSSLVALYEYQRTIGFNQHPHPNTSRVKALMRSRRTAEAARKKEQFIDRGVGTLLDSYNGAEVSAFVRLCWTGHERQGQVKQQTVESFLRTSVDLLACHHMALRGESIRTASLADLFSLELQNEGPTVCQALIIIMDGGKQNPFGKVEYGTVVRHRDIFSCT